MSLTMGIFIHMDAVGRNEWTGDGDERPLTAVGQQQAERIAEELGASQVDAIYSSPALRCRASLEPLARKTGKPVQVLAGFRDTQGYKAPAGWENPSRPGPDPLGGAYSAGSAFAALKQVQTSLPNGRAVLCSYGDIVPAVLSFVAGAGGGAIPPRLEGRGCVYTVVLDGDKITLSGREAPAGFPA
jgi:broad specificity phosphatase PhoE